jgi:hypothetical protein
LQGSVYTLQGRIDRSQRVKEFWIMANGTIEILRMARSRMPAQMTGDSYYFLYSLEDAS